MALENPKRKTAIWALVLGCLMLVGGGIAAFGGGMVALFGAMGHQLSQEMSDVQTVTETWCDTCDFRMSIQVGQFSHKDGDPCTERGCTGTLHIKSRKMTPEEREKAKQEWEPFTSGTKTAQRIGGAAAILGGIFLLSGLAALVACYGLSHRRRWGRILALLVIVPALAGTAVAGVGQWPCSPSWRRSRCSLRSSPCGSSWASKEVDTLFF